MLCWNLLPRIQNCYSFAEVHTSHNIRISYTLYRSKENNMKVYCFQKLVPFFTEEGANAINVQETIQILLCSI